MHTNTFSLSPWVLSLHSSPWQDLIPYVGAVSCCLIAFGTLPSSASTAFVIVVIALLMLTLIVLVGTNCIQSILYPQMVVGPESLRAITAHELADKGQFSISRCSPSTSCGRGKSHNSDSIIARSSSNKCSSSSSTALIARSGEVEGRKLSNRSGSRSKSRSIPGILTTSLSRARLQVRARASVGRGCGHTRVSDHSGPRQPVPECRSQLAWRGS